MPLKAVITPTLSGGGTIAGDVTITGNLTVTGTTTSVVNQAVSGKITVTVADANAITAGLAGETNPVIKINTATALQATGIEITGAAAGGGAAVEVIGGTNEDLTIKAQGTGNVIFATASTDYIQIGTNDPLYVGNADSGSGPRVRGVSGHLYLQPSSSRNLELRDDAGAVRFQTGHAASNPGSMQFTGSLSAATGDQYAVKINYTTNKATSGNDTGLLINHTDTASPGTSLIVDLQVASVSKIQVSNAGVVTGNNSGFLTLSAASEGLQYNAVVADTGDPGHRFNVSDTSTATSGELSFGRFSGNTFAPTSGTAISNILTLLGTVNQTGGASGITRGIYVNITNTASADLRLLDLAIGGTTKFKVDAAGKVTASATLDAATGNEVALALNYTVNKATSGNDTGLLVNMTDTLSPGTSNLVDFQTGGSTKFKVDFSGKVNFVAQLQNSNTNGGCIAGVNATSTVPTLCPGRADINTGIGWTSTDIMNLITGGVSAVTIDASQNSTFAGDVSVTGRVLAAQGSDVASADEIVLGTDGNYFDITGTTTINHIRNTGWTAGSMMTLQFDGSVTVTHNVGGAAGAEADILLAGAVDFSATAGDTLTLRYDGTTFREIARTAI